MDDPDFIRELDGIDDTKGIASVRECDLQHAGTETVQRFGNVSFSAFRRDRERTQENGFGPLWKLLKILECRLDP